MENLMNQALLMCSPDYFGIRYIINPWMEGQVGKTDSGEASRQWTAFYNVLQRYADVYLIEPQPHVPDLVFTANAGLSRGNKFVPSRFRHQERRLEEPFFKDWFKTHGSTVEELPDHIHFEGAGDALFQPGYELLWAGYGFRTDLESHQHLAKLFRVKVISLHLGNPRFYHLDTCFCPLLDGQAMYYPGAFDAASVKAIKENTRPRDRIVVSHEDAVRFACNAVLVDTTVFLNHASADLKKNLEKRGYSVHVQPVTEFIKSGGANKCLTISIGDYDAGRSLHLPAAA